MAKARVSDSVTVTYSAITSFLINKVSDKAKVLALVALPVLLAACGGSSDNDENTSDDDLNDAVSASTITADSADSADGESAATVEDSSLTGAPDANTDSSSLIALDVPANCGVITLPNSEQVCINATDGNNLFSLAEDGGINFAVMLPEDAVLANTRVISGSNLYALNPSSADRNNWLLTAIDAGGNVLYTSVVGRDIVTIETGFSIAPYLFLHTIDEAGESSIFQINEATGAIRNVLQLGGQNVERVGSQSFDGATFISIQSDGVTSYRDSERLEPYVRGFTFSPESFEQEFINLMNVARANYVGQFIDVFNRTNPFAATTSAGTTLPCVVSGTLEVLPQSSLLIDDNVTRAYHYDNCIINDKIINGTIIYSSQTTPPEIAGGNRTLVNETMEFRDVAVSRLIDNPGLQGTISSDLFTLSASLENSLILSGGGTTMEINKDLITTVSRYTQSSEGDELVSITDSSYEAKSYQLLNEDQSQGASNVRESGGMTLQLQPDLSITLLLTAPLFYEMEGTESQLPVIITAPLAGTVRIRSTDGSTLDVNANLAGVNMQNYLLTQAGEQTSVDSIWNVAPVNIQPSLVQLP